MSEPMEPLEPSDPEELPEMPAPVVMVRDPVCGSAVDPAGAAATAFHRGERYYFCSKACREVFAADPARYTGVD
jgi:Cu+-exporting ATPase